MPSPRNGTVSNDIGKAISDALRGVTEIKPDKSAAIHTGIGKLSFGDEQLCDNLREFIVRFSRECDVDYAEFDQAPHGEELHPVGVCVFDTQSVVLPGPAVHHAWKILFQRRVG